MATSMIFSSSCLLALKAPAKTFEYGEYPALVGVFVDLGNVVDGGFCPAIEIDSCQIDGAVEDGIRFVNVKTSTVKNSIVTNNGVSGIALLEGTEGGSQFNTLLNNVVFANESNGIFVSTNSTFNAVKDNTVSNNG